MWTTNSITMLKELLAEGLSYGEIAKKLNDKFGTEFTRNSIAGKAYRGNLLCKVQIRDPRKSRTLPKAIERERITMSLNDLKSGGCRYTQDAKSFCGEPIVPKKSYCEYHHAICSRKRAE